MKATSLFESPSIVSVTTEDVDYPKENILTIDLTTLSWRTTTTGSQGEMVLDFGSILTQPLDLILWNVNVNTMVVKAHPTNSFGTPDFDSGSLTSIFDMDLNIYKQRVTIVNDFRFIKIEIPVQTPIDNTDDFFEIASMFIPQTEQSFNSVKDSFEFSLPADVELPEAIVEANTRIEQVSIGDMPKIHWTFGGRFGNDSATRTKLMNVFGRLGQPLVYFRLETANTWEFYIGKRRATISQEWINPSLRRIGIDIVSL